ncbi:endolytic transglycosylase MltG [Candidatus Saccharibacteria bacterium]|nr:endolytic transglycosylase MltG [Candidatus Saccharibacteria bacterium]
MPDNFTPSELPPVLLPEDSFKLQRPRRRKWLIIVASIVVVLIASCFAVLWWYDSAKQPVMPSATQTTTIVVDQGASPVDVGYLLHTNKLIRSTLAYRIYLKLNGTGSQIQAGTYELSASMDLASIVERLTKGQTANFSITFYPGATLFDPRDLDDTKRTDVYSLLLRAGYEDQEIREALEANYNSPLFADKPAGTSLEGYVYGETYTLATTAEVKDILEYSFKVFYQDLIDNDVISRVEQRGLTLYEAITLASIVQREVSDYQDMRKVAQVFYTRLEQNMQLGSDVTFIYAANQANETPRVNFPSPYNTRINTGLPPGPIATPGIDALRAVADPASTEYVYFLAGEDGKTYFAYTEEEHNTNIVNHCGDLCN